MTTTIPATYTLPMQRDVALFHDAFGMPNLIATPGPLPLNRIELRIGLIREEGVVELTQAILEKNVIGMIDALVDTIYVSLGAEVEMGAIADHSLLIESNVLVTPPKDLHETARATLAYVRDYLPLLEAAFREEDVARSVEILRAITRSSLHALIRAGIDPQPFFDEVQRANMSKLGADGKPVHSRGLELDGFPAGKVLKGPFYSAPNLGAVYERFYPENAEEVVYHVVSADFRRGARAAAEAMKFYFLNENEGPLYEEISNEDLDDFEQGAIRDVLRDEQLRIERGLSAI